VQRSSLTPHVEFAGGGGGEDQKESSWNSSKARGPTIPRFSNRNLRGKKLGEEGGRPGEGAPILPVDTHGGLERKKDFVRKRKK